MCENNSDDKLERLEERVKKLERKVSTKLYTQSKKEIVEIPKEMLNIAEAANFLGLEVNGLRMLMHKKLIPYYKPNGKKLCYFDPQELKEWQKRNRQKPVYETDDSHPEEGEGMDS